MTRIENLVAAVKEYQDFVRKGTCSICDPSVGYTCETCYLEGKMWKALHEYTRVEDNLSDEEEEEDGADHDDPSLCNSSPPKRQLHDVVTFVFSGMGHPKCFRSVAAALQWVDEQHRRRTAASSLYRILSVVRREEDGACHRLHLPPEISQDCSRWFVTVRGFIVRGFLIQGNARS